MEKKRDGWSGNLGFVLATAGSAVGLGNIWGFPTKAATGGGGIFVLSYLIIMIVVCVPAMLSEMSIGRHTGLSPYSALKSMNKGAGFIGALGVFTSLLILPFYCVIGGWVLKYMSEYLIGIGGTAFGSDVGMFFTSFISGAVEPCLWALAFLAVTLVIVLGGVSKGIEKANKIMMPLLLLLLLVLVIRSLSLPGAAEGLSYLFIPRIEGVDVFKTILSAMGQAFFSLSIGMGILITYGSYVGKQDSLTASTGKVVVIDTIIALLAGMMVLPVVVSSGLGIQDAMAAGPGLVFVTLPDLFKTLPMGAVFGLVFFLLFTFAALTSSISLLEVGTRTAMDVFKWDRKKSVAAVASLIAILILPTALSQGAVELNLFGMNFFDFLDYLTAKILLPLGGLLICLYVGWVWPAKNAVMEIESGGVRPFRLAGLWSAMVKFVVPAAILLIFVTSL